MPAKAKLTDEEVKRIRRRVRAGTGVIDLADEFGVSRKTIRRRLDALERAETERAQRIAEKRRRRQAARERRTLREREQAAGFSPRDEGRKPEERLPRERPHVRDPYLEWRDRRKNLSGRALSEANGLVRVSSPDGARCVWRERSEIDALLEAGWRLA